MYILDQIPLLLNSLLNVRIAARLLDIQLLISIMKGLDWVKIMARVLLVLRLVMNKEISLSILKHYKRPQECMVHQRCLFKEFQNH